MLKYFRKTVAMREKGNGLDYRFTPELNLPSLQIENDWVEKARNSISFIMPHFKYINDFNFPPYFSLQIIVRYCLFYFFYYYHN